VVWYVADTMLLTLSCWHYVADTSVHSSTLCLLFTNWSKIIHT